MHIAQTAYPLSIVHHYVLKREEARDLAGVVAQAPRKTLEKLHGAPLKRLIADEPLDPLPALDGAPPRPRTPARRASVAGVTGPAESSGELTPVAAGTAADDAAGRRHRFPRSHCARRNAAAAAAGVLGRVRRL
jgi:hypothetical protein